MDTIRVVVADDHPLMLSGIRGLLEKEVDIDIVGEAASGAEALRLTVELNPDILILDMRLPDMTGVEVAERLKEANPSVRILAFSEYDDPQYIFGLLESGAAGYLTKDEPRDAVVDAIRFLMERDGLYLSRRIKEMLRARDDRLDNLTEAERAILHLLTQGLTNQEIADDRDVRAGTIKSQLNRLYAKIGVSNRTEAAIWALKHGLG